MNKLNETNYLKYSNPFIKRFTRYLQKFYTF